MGMHRFFTCIFILICILAIVANIFPVEAQKMEYSPSNNPDTMTVTPEITSQIGGSMQAVAWQNNFVYIAAGLRILIVDVTDPTSPQLAGKTELMPENITDIAVAGSYAYAVGFYSGLRIIDVSDPANPDEVGFYDPGGYAVAVTIAGGYAYIADGWNGMSILDLTDPIAPREVGQYETSDMATNVAVEGTNAYIISNYGGLHILNISDPTAPTEIGFYSEPHNNSVLAVAGNYAYINRSGDLIIIDVSDPAVPLEVGSCGLPRPPDDIVVVGSFAYVADWNYGLLIIDISDPTAPAEVGYYYPPQSLAHASAMVGRYAYLVDITSGLRIIDVSIPSAPTEVGYYQAFASAGAVAVVGNYAYVANGYYGVHIIDISNPAVPVELGLLPTPGIAENVRVAGSYAYVADGTSGLRIIDVSNPADPTEIGSYDTPGTTWDVTLVDHYAFVADGESGLRIIDISNPELPIEVGALDTSGSCNAVAVSGHYAYVADGESGLRIIDISNLAAPQEVGFYMPPVTFYANDIAVKGNYAFGTFGKYGGFQVIDISNPSDPIVVGHGGIVFGATSVSLAGDYAFVSDGPVLRIIDISDPTAPVTSGTYEGYATDTVSKGNYAFVASFDNSLVILRLLSDKVSGLIPVAGGSLTSTDGNTDLIFANGAFTQTVNLTYRQFLYQENLANRVEVGRTFELTAVYSDTGKTANLAPGQTFSMTIAYSDTLPGPSIENTMAIYNWDGFTWVREPTSSVDTGNHIITATPNYFSRWAVLGEARRVLLPIIGRQ